MSISTTKITVEADEIGRGTVVRVEHYEDTVVLRHDRFGNVYMRRGDDGNNVCIFGRQIGRVFSADGISWLVSHSQGLNEPLMPFVGDLEISTEE